MFSFIPASNGFSRMIIIATFLIVIIVTIQVIIRNLSIYKHLKRQLDSSSTYPENSEFWRELKQQYDLQNKDENDHIDVQAFVEAFMTNYSSKYSSSSMLSSINRIHSAGSTVILIGVLGTFVGLISALYGLDINGAEFQSSIQNVLDGIYTAFYTSVFGIVSSLIISFVHKTYDAKHLLLQLTLRAENLLQAYAKHTWESRMVDSLTRVKNAIEDMHKSLRELDHFSETMERASENMNVYNEKFAENTTVLYGIFNNMETVGENFNARMDNLNEHFDELVQHFGKQGEALQSIDGGIRHLTEGVSSFVEGTSKHVETLTKENKVFLNDTTEKLQESFNHLQAFFSNNVRQLERIVESVSQMERKNQDYITNIGKATDTIREVLADRTFDQLMNVTKKFTENVMLLENHFIRLQDHYERLDKERNEFASFYNSQREELTRVRDEINRFASNNEGVRRQFEEIKYVFEAAERSNRELIQSAYEINREVKDSIKQSSGEQAKQLKQLSYEFNNHLNEAFRNLDSILSKNLANSIEQFEHYISNTNQAIERQFGAINDFVQNNIKSNNSINRDVLNSVDDMRGRINRWDEQLRQSIRSRHGEGV